MGGSRRQQGNIGCLGILFLVLIIAMAADQCSWFDSPSTYQSTRSGVAVPFQHDAECGSLRTRIRNMDSQITAILKYGDGVPGACKGVDSKRMRAGMAALMKQSTPALLDRCESKGYRNLRRDGRALAAKTREAAEVLAVVERVMRLNRELSE